MTKVDAPGRQDHVFPVYEIEVKSFGQEEPVTERVDTFEDETVLQEHIKYLLSVGFQHRLDDGWVEVVPASRIQRIKYREVT